jgi:hypothetical protein
MPTSYFTEPDPELPGYERFTSKVRCFPISIALPEDVQPFYDSTALPRVIRLDSPNTCTVWRRDLSVSTSDYAREVLQGKKPPSHYIRRDIEGRQKFTASVTSSYRPDKFRVWESSSSRVFVGSGEYVFPAGLVISESGDWDTVFFYDILTHWMWEIRPDKESSRFEDSVFETVLSSFRWLNDAYFSSLP